MSSIRPLAMITVLALVGAFLLMRINQTEPPLPADIANWTMPNQLDIGTPSAPGGTVVPSAPAAAATTSAPSYTPPPTITTAPTFTSAPPPFKPQSEPTVSSAAPPLEVPELPPLPTLPPPKTAAATQAPAAAASVNIAPSVTIAPPITSAPVGESPVTTEAQAAVDHSSLFAATRTAVQAALDRGELSQALLLLSDWYGDPLLTPAETQEVNSILGQLAGSVIYSTEHRLEPPYMVQAGEQLPDIAKKYNVPWQLLAKINGMAETDQLQPGRQLKVVRGPFSALVDLSERRMTIMLDRRYAGQFPIEIEPTTSVEEGQWSVNQKLLTPGSASPLSANPSAGDQKSIMITSAAGGANQIVILRGANSSTPATTDPAGRVIRLKSKDVDDVYDILSLGSSVTIRR